MLYIGGKLYCVFGIGGQRGYMSSIQNVALKAGVSTATVSRVLSQPSLVKETTRNRVMKAIDELNYQPNSAARTLRTLKAFKLLITVPDISNPFFSCVIKGAEEAAKEAGYAIILGSTNQDSEVDARYSAMFRRKEVDGLVFLGHEIPKVVRELMRDKPDFPIVTDCEFKPTIAVSGVFIDHFKAGYDAIKYLNSLGHSHIGIIDGPILPILSSDRMRGAQQAATELGINPSFAQGVFNVDSGFEAASKLLQKKVTALFCLNDEMAIGALSAIKACGLECPRDVSVIGFDDIRFSRYANPPLTTIAQPKEDIGRRIVEVLLQIISGEIIFPRSIVLPHELVIRGSTAPLAGT